MRDHAESRRSSGAALLEAVRAYDVNAARAALEAGADPDIRDGEDLTPLMIASGDPATPEDQGNPELVRHLLSHGADPNARGGISGDETPLLKAAGSGAARAARLLLDAGAEPDGSSLLEAARRGQAEAIELLVRSGVDVDARDEAGETALMRAAEARSADAVSALLHAGADALARDGQGMTALHRASRAGAVEAVRILLDHADADERARGGATPLMLAVEAENAETMRVLLEHGADPAARDLDGRTPVKIALADLRFPELRELTRRAAGPKAHLVKEAGLPFVVLIGGPFLVLLLVLNADAFAV